MTAQPIPPLLPRMRRHPIQWRPMARVTWLQHRGSLITAIVLFAGYALVIVESTLGPRSDYARFVASRCLTSSRGSVICTDLFNSIAAQTTSLSLITIALLVIPVLAGTFIGVPLLAREIESGTFRFAWTQGIGRTRWMVTKMALLCGGAGGVALAGWAVQHYGAHPPRLDGVFPGGRRLRRAAHRTCRRGDGGNRGFRRRPPCAGFYA